MLSSWDKFIPEILMNLESGKPRNTAPIDGNDITHNIVPLTRMDALILWELYFPESVKYALLYERTYGEPRETLLLDESETNHQELKETLKSMHAANSKILIYWNNYIALKTTWDMLIKYWDNFFYYPEDAIIYLDQKHIYFYNEMTLKKLNNLHHMQNESIYKCLEKLNKKKKTKQQQRCLQDGISSDFQEELFYLFNIICDGLRAIDNDEIRKAYLEYCVSIAHSKTEKIVLASKPYNHESLQHYMQSVRENKESEIKLSADKFYDILDRIVREYTSL